MGTTILHCLHCFYFNVWFSVLCIFALQIQLPTDCMAWSWKKRANSTSERRTKFKVQFSSFPAFVPTQYILTLVVISSCHLKKDISFSQTKAFSLKVSKYQGFTLSSIVLLWKRVYLFSITIVNMFSAMSGLNWKSIEEEMKKVSFWHFFCYNDAPGAMGIWHKVRRQRRQQKQRPLQLHSHDPLGLSRQTKTNINVRTLLQE